MKRKKKRTFILLAVATIVLTSCNNTDTLISNNENAESKTLQSRTANHDTNIEAFFISWNGNIEKFNGSLENITGIIADITSLAWIAPRGGSEFNFESREIKDSDNQYILESSQALSMQDDSSLTCNLEDWVRIVRDKAIKTESGTTVSGDKDILIYKQNKSLFLAVQSEDLETWTIWELPEYGAWLDKEIQIFMRMATGL